MQSDLRAVSSVVVALCLFACPEGKPAAQPQSRFAGVTSKPVVEASAKQFCDRTWSASGEASKPFQPPPTKPFDGGTATPERVKGWRWVNLWATWCAPCVEEMPLLGRWKSAFEKDGVALSFDMVSIDEVEAEAAMRTWLGKLPGALVWARSPEDASKWLESSVGVSADSAIPIHILVDPSGAQRCVRVGAVHAQDYGAVKAFISGQ